MKRRKWTIFLVIILLVFIVVIISAILNEKKPQAEALPISKNQQENEQGQVEISNPYFYQESCVMLEANAEYQCFEEFQKTPVKISGCMIKEYPEGMLYKLVVDSEGQLTDASLSDAETRLRMYFYVTEDQIYRVQPYLVVGQGMITFYDNDWLLTLLLDSEEKIINNSRLVCGTSDIFSDLEEGEPGVHEGIVRNGNQISYSRCDVKPNGTPGFYEQFIWEKDKGLVRYESGYSAEREILNLSEIKE